MDVSGFKNIEDIKAFVNKNSNYLQLLEDESGELHSKLNYIILPSDIF